MSLFRRRPPRLDDPTVVGLMDRAANDLDYGAVKELHALFGNVASADTFWVWWIDQCKALALAGKRDVAHLGIAFARKANVAPFPGHTEETYDRMREVEQM